MKIAPEFFEDISLAANSLRDIDDLVKEISEEYEIEKDYVHHLIVKTREEKKKLAKKYEMTNESIDFQGVTLYRIKALKDFADVKKGDLGGYIQKQSNLSLKGDCWVYGDAKVYGNTRVSDSAVVFGNAKVYGDARVSSNAVVCGNAEVYGSAEVRGDARVYGYAKVYDRARVYDSAVVRGNTRVFEDAWICDTAQVGGKVEVCGTALVHGYAQIKGDQIIRGGIYNLPEHTPTSDIDKGIEDAKAGRISELTTTLLEEEENKMRTLKQLEKMWDEYCKASDINVTDDIQIQLNVSEPRLKVGIFRGDKGMHFTEEEIKALVEVLDSL